MSNLQMLNYRWLNTEKSYEKPNSSDIWISHYNIQQRFFIKETAMQRIKIGAPVCTWWWVHFRFITVARIQYYLWFWLLNSMKKKYRYELNTPWIHYNIQFSIKSIYYQHLDADERNLDLFQSFKSWSFLMIVAKSDPQQQIVLYCFHFTYTCSDVCFAFAHPSSLM